MNDNAVKNGQVLDMALYAYTRQDTQFPVRRLYPEEIQTALDLSWDVFLQFEAPEYSEEGVQEFRKSLDDKERTRKLQYTFCAMQASKQQGKSVKRGRDLFIEEKVYSIRTQITFRPEISGTLSAWHILHP